MVARTVDWAGHDGQGNRVSGSLTVNVGDAAVRMLLGCSASKWPHPGPWDYMRCYSSDHVDTAVRFGAGRVGLTFDDNPSTATVVSRLQGILAKYPTLLVDYARKNEADRSDHTADDQIDDWARATKADQDAIAQAFPNGNVTCGADFTVNNVRNGRTELFYQALEAAGYDPDPFVSWFSMYPAGRNQTPAVESKLDDHIGVCVAIAKRHGAKRIGCWETGTPLSTRYDRPTVVAKWAPYLEQTAAAAGMEPIAMCYWDSTKGGTGDPDNRFQADAPKTQQAFQTSLS